MNQPTRIAIGGFSTFERATFESFFRLSKRRTPAYELSARLEDSEFVIVDAESASSLAALDAAGRRSRAIAIGATPQPGVAVQLPRPINLMAVVKALDQQTRSGAVPTAGEPAVVEQRTAIEQPAPSMPPSMSAPSWLPMPASPRQALPAALEAQPVPVPGARPQSPPLDPMLLDEAPAPSLDHILVVDDSDIALRFMAGRLERFGFVVHLARSGEEALQRCEQKDFSFVFMDVNMPGLDGFRTCKGIKRRPYLAGQEPPTVVMLTSRDTAVDKLRGTMAGCDAYLTKPLDEGELIKVIGEREVRQSSFADTRAATRL